MLEKIFKIGPKKTDKIEIWTILPGLSDVMPVQESSNFIPKWFLDTPSWPPGQEEETKNEPNFKGTIKRCPALPDLMHMGVVIPLWVDLKLKIHTDGTYEWKTPVETHTPEQFVEHSAVQLTNYLQEDQKPTLVLKADCPWKIRTPPGIVLLQLPMFWYFNQTFTVPPGIIWSEFHHSINQQIMFHKKGEILLKRGTPLAQYIPIRRETFEYYIGEPTEELTKAGQGSYLNTIGTYFAGYSNKKKRILKGER